MKKFLSIVLALVLVCSMATVAFAAVAQTNTCPFCGLEIADEAEYNLHITKDCNKKYRACKWECGAGFSTDEAKAAHEDICPFGSAKCDYCGETFSPVQAYNDHLAACKESHLNIPADKFGETIKGFDWNGLIAKIIDFFSGLIEKIVGLF